MLKDTLLDNGFSGKGSLIYLEIISWNFPIHLPKNSAKQLYNYLMMCQTYLVYSGKFNPDMEKH